MVVSQTEAKPMASNNTDNECAIPVSVLKVQRKWRENPIWMSDTRCGQVVAICIVKTSMTSVDECEREPDHESKEQSQSLAETYQCLVPLILPSPRIVWHPLIYSRLEILHLVPPFIYIYIYKCMHVKCNKGRAPVTVVPTPLTSAYAKCKLFTSNGWFVEVGTLSSSYVLVAGDRRALIPESSIWGRMEGVAWGVRLGTRRLRDWD